jgi:hypothetical protein
MLELWRTLGALFPTKNQTQINIYVIHNERINDTKTCRMPPSSQNRRRLRGLRDGGGGGAGNASHEDVENDENGIGGEEREQVRNRRESHRQQSEQNISYTNIPDGTTISNNENVPPNNANNTSSSNHSNSLNSNILYAINYNNPTQQQYRRNIDHNAENNNNNNASNPQPNVTTSTSTVTSSRLCQNRTVSRAQRENEET